MLPKKPSHESKPTLEQYIDYTRRLTAYFANQRHPADSTSWRSDPRFGREWFQPGDRVTKVAYEYHRDGHPESLLHRWIGVVQHVDEEKGTALIHWMGCDDFTPESLSDLEECGALQVDAINAAEEL